MRTNTYLIVKVSMLLLLALPLIFIACEEIDDDPCDDSTKPEIAVTIKATAYVLGANNQPIPNVDIKINYWKQPCGDAIKGQFYFSGKTDEFGVFYGNLVGYNLRNSEDEVVAEAIAPDLENFHEQNFAIARFKYGDFSTLSTKQVSLYIYTKDVE